MASVSPPFVDIPARRMPPGHPRFGMPAAGMIRVRLRDSPFVNRLTRRRIGARSGVNAIFPDPFAIDGPRALPGPIRQVQPEKSCISRRYCMLTI